MSIKELLERNRSIRRFDESKRINESELKELVSLVKYCASGRNLQPLKYRIVSNPEECALVYPHLKWAGYLADWDGPEPGERPTAYLVQCLDTELTTDCLCDDGLQLEAITLAATEKGLGGCIIKAFNPAAMAEVLGIPHHLKPRYVLALGYPVEKVEIVPMNTNEPEGYKYYRKPDGTHCVPKRENFEI